jgi:uncharacterized protein
VLLMSSETNLEMCEVEIHQKPYVLADIPTLWCFRESPQQGAKKGVILLFHGLFSNKEANLKELLFLAKAGFLAIGVDAPGHGDRPPFEPRRDLPEDQKFLDLVLKSAREIPSIVDELVCAGLVVNAKNLAVTGISLGGYIAYASVLWEPRIRSVAPILGSPCWNHSLSPHRFPGKFREVNLMAQNAGKDDSVPYEPSRDFVDRLQQLFCNSEDASFSYRVYPDSGHFMEADDWDKLLAELNRFFTRTLKG